jgi:hypothetical protein
LRENVPTPKIVVIMKGCEKYVKQLGACQGSNSNYDSRYRDPNRDRDRNRRESKEFDPDSDSDFDFDCTGTKKTTKCGVAWIRAAGMAEHFVGSSSSAA